MKFVLPVLSVFAAAALAQDDTSPVKPSLIVDPAPSRYTLRPVSPTLIVDPPPTRYPTLIVDPTFVISPRPRTTTSTSSSSSTYRPTVRCSATTTYSTPQPTASPYGQCGGRQTSLFYQMYLSTKPYLSGNTYRGPTICPCGYKCVVLRPDYYQVRPTGVLTSRPQVLTSIETSISASPTASPRASRFLPLLQLLLALASILRRPSSPRRSRTSTQVPNPPTNKVVSRLDHH